METTRIFPTLNNTGGKELKKQFPRRELEIIRYRKWTNSHWNLFHAFTKHRIFMHFILPLFNNKPPLLKETNGENFFFSREFRDNFAPNCELNFGAFSSCCAGKSRNFAKWSTRYIPTQNRVGNNKDNDLTTMLVPEYSNKKEWNLCWYAFIEILDLSRSGRSSPG